MTTHTTKAADTPVLNRPLVLESPKKKKKKKYTRGTKGLQDFVQGLEDATYRATNSVARGSKTFSKRSKKSSRKRRDGLVWDSVRNAGDSLGDGLFEFSKAPGALTRQIRTGQIRRTVRSFLRPR